MEATKESSLSFIRVGWHTHRTLFSSIGQLRIGGCLKVDADEWQGRGTYTLGHALRLKTKRHKGFVGKSFSVRKTTDKGWMVKRTK